MNRQSKFKFQDSYNRDFFLSFIKTKLFPDNLDTEMKWENIEHNYKLNYIKSIKKLWEINFKKNIDIREIKHDSQYDPRVSITKEVFKVMNWKKTVLAIFYCNNSNEYRFSLITHYYGDDMKEESNPRRLSFLLGEWCKSKTPEEYLIDKWEIKDEKDLYARFNVEVVTDKFFDEYLKLFFELYIALMDESDGNEFKSEVVEEQGVDPVKFTKNLLSKLVFLYFIQKKWWLWGQSEDWKDWDWNFIFNLWKDYKNNNESKIPEEKRTWNFYHDYLEYLFYEGLNNNERENWFDKYFKCKIPFLNWWLFRQEYNKDNKKANVRPKDSVFYNEKTWVLDIFELYNFTVYEEDLENKEMAIDPNMLGQIFEKLIIVTKNNIEQLLKEYIKRKTKWKKIKMNIEKWKVNNKNLWAFYTPREIVDYMSKKSLIYTISQYLLEKNIYWQNHKKIESIVKKIFQYKDKNIFKKEIEKNSKEDFLEIISMIEDIDIYLKEVKILDPAVWSWAYPIWIMHEIQNIRQYIYEQFLESKKHIKWQQIVEEILKNNLYWVDIDPGAISIARLRFWLTLVIYMKSPDPLPNLEFKLVCGNTLIPLEARESLFDEDKDIYNRIRKLSQKWFRPKTKEERREILIEYTNLLNKLWEKYKFKSRKSDQINSYKPFNIDCSSIFFDSYFMFGINKFDLVIGNPPYINIKSGFSEEIKNIYTKIYKTAVWQYDLFSLFLEYSLNYGKIVSLIIPKPFIVNENYIEIRKLILNKWIKELLTWSNIFKTANVESSMIITNYIEEKNIEISIFEKKTIQKISDFNKDFSEIIPLKIISPEISIKNISIIKKVIKWSQKAWIILDIKRWVEAGKKDSSITNKKNTTPVLFWENIQRYNINYQKKYILYDDRNEKKFKNINMYKWKKILLRRVGNNIIATLDLNNFIWLNTIYFLKVIDEKYNIHYILWLLNSKLISYWFINVFVLTDKLFPYIRKSQLNYIPIKPFSTKIQKLFIKIIDRILSITSVEGYSNEKKLKKEIEDLEREIDLMVYKIYEITYKEVKIVDKDFWMVEEKYNSYKIWDNINITSLEAEANSKTYAITMQNKENIFNGLSEVIAQIAKETNREISEIMSMKTLEEITKIQPKTKDELMKTWKDKEKVEIYWDRILNFTNKY